MYNENKIRRRAEAINRRLKLGHAKKTLTLPVAKEMRAELQRLNKLLGKVVYIAKEPIRIKDNNFFRTYPPAIRIGEDYVADRDKSQKDKVPSLPKKRSGITRTPLYKRKQARRKKTAATKRTKRAA